MIVKSMKQFFERQRNDDYSKQQIEIIYEHNSSSTKKNKLIMTIIKIF